MNPDVRRRVGAMMAANPNLQVNSGYRNSTQQKRLYDSGMVRAARPGHSPHGRGQAADLGPPSQYGWLAKNARKFGLDTAGHLGEPWHVQTAGTISGLGDPTYEDELAKARDTSIALAFARMNSSAATTAAGAASPSTTGASAVSAGTVGLDEVAKALYSAGFRGDDLVNMIAIPSRESSYNTGVHNLNTKTGDDSWGLWQINVAPGANRPTLVDVTGKDDPTQLTDPYTAAQVAYAMYQRSGNTLRPWGGYKGLSNTYGVSPDAIEAARNEARSLGYVGDPNGNGGGGGGGGNTTVSSTPIVFNNTFPISMSGGGGQDLDSLARQLSTKLEAQFRRATATRR
jgi:hypothetical protein